MSKRFRDKSLGSQYHEPEADTELYDELITRIAYKSSLSIVEAEKLADIISTGIGHLCAAFADGFIEEIDTSIGTDDYSVRVFLSRDNQRII